ncbi:MAG: esterase [Burkholderiales bacterium]|nr:esterase [Burkholderiales bacterium]
MIIYVHGFNSSPASHKANQLRERLALVGRESEFLCPALSHWPQQALTQLHDEVAKLAPEKVTLVGSSLGGFYATWLTERCGCRSVLVNPAITPHEGLRAFLGKQRNLYTDEEYDFTEEHLAQLKAIYIPRPIHISCYLLMHTTGDELLDWRVAVQRYRGCRQVVVEGSDHGFSEFGDYIECVLEFARN